jgi:hypothetical protein
MTTAELIEKLRELDPAGTTQVVIEDDDQRMGEIARVELQEGYRARAVRLDFGDRVWLER